MNFHRNCPKCNTQLSYKSSGSRDKAEATSTLCRNCARVPRGKSEHLLCPTCSESFYREGTLNKHLYDLHEINDPLVSYLSTNKMEHTPLCKCGCGNQVEWHGWRKGFNKLISGHNGNIYKVHSPERAKEISDARKKKLTGKIGWSRGLSKETDERIEFRGEKIAEAYQKKRDNNEEAIAWNRGLTKETDIRVAKSATDSRIAFASGIRTSWTRGLSKENDQRLANLGASVKIACNNPQLRTRLDDLKRIKPNEIKTRIELSGVWNLITDDLHPNTHTEAIQCVCKTCNNIIIAEFKQIEHSRCRICFPNGSIGEQEVYEFVTKVLGIGAISCSRNIIPPLELDVFIPSHRVAIEYNGLYFHSMIAGKKNKFYHQNKSELCQRAGINLIHVFEDDWRDRQDIVKSIIAKRLGISITSSAHQIKFNINRSECEKFMVENHIQGPAQNYSGCIGFESNGRLDAMATWIIENEVCKINRLTSRNMQIPENYVKRTISAISTLTDQKQIEIDIDSAMFTGTTLINLGFKQTKITQKLWLTDHQNRYVHNTIDDDLVSQLDTIFSCPDKTFVFLKT